MTVLTIDVGNSQILFGVFIEKKLKFKFIKSNQTVCSSDELGLFMVLSLREYKIYPDNILYIVISSVVPKINDPIKYACIKYFNCHPFILEINSNLEIGIKSTCSNFTEIGSDRIANCIGTNFLFPNKNAIIVDFGTATTICILKNGIEYIGGIIFPGLHLLMKSLEENTAKLSEVNIKIPKKIIGNSTEEHIQSGIYFGTLGLIKETIKHVRSTLFTGKNMVIVATGGFSNIFSLNKLFHFIEKDLVLFGLLKFLYLNLKKI